MRKLFVAVFALVVLASAFVAVAAAQDNVVNEPVVGDVFLSGDTVSVDASVDGDVFAAGGVVRINAQVTGDVFVVGGQVFVDAPIGGSLVAAGGQVVVLDDVAGKVIAAGGTLEIGGEVEKVIAAGGTVSILSDALVEEYARIYGGTVTNAGTVTDELIVRSGTFDNTGSAGEVDFQPTEMPDYGWVIAGIIGIVQIVVTIGFLLLGVALLRFFPRQFTQVETVLRNSSIRNTVVGFLLIIVIAIVTVILAVTIVGIPFAMIVGLSFTIALLISQLFVSLALGRKLSKWLNFKASETWLFVLGFIILNILYIIPIAGPIINIITVSLGFGAIIFTIRNKWSSITAKEPQPQTIKTD